MQRAVLNSRDRALSLSAVLLVHAAVVLAMLHASSRGSFIPDRTAPLRTFDVVEEEPPPALREPPEERAPREEGAASQPGMTSRATPVAAPRPSVLVPRPDPVVASETSSEGNQPTQGAAPVAGPGTGSGGSGIGTGSGGAGSGVGGGGLGSPPRLLSDRITRRDFPRELRNSAEPAFVLRVEFTVGTDGRPRNCQVVQSSGIALLDRHTCDLYQQKVRYEPARDRSGQPIEVEVRTTRSWYIEGRARPVGR